ALAGVEGTEVSSAAETENAFTNALSGDAGIVIMTEDTADMIRERVDSYVLSETFPLILEIAGPQGRKPDRPTIREMVNQAIGMDL
ncbi:MAG: V-type ATP synthase subunit F, partial [Spirochaetota bacterium]